MATLPASMWRILIQLQGEAGPDHPVFRSAKKAAIWIHPPRIAWSSAPPPAPASPRRLSHWLRHTHASHALDHGAPIHLVQATLGRASVATTGRYLHVRPNDSSARYLLV
jgi:integrase/recombinase XerD